jgi:hypothetical protein
MSGQAPPSYSPQTGPTPCPAMILPAKFTKKASDPMNFVNFAGKGQCFQGAPPGFRAGRGLRIGSAGGRPRPAAAPKLTLRAPGPIPAALSPRESL